LVSFPFLYIYIYSLASARYFNNCIINHQVKMFNPNVTCLVSWDGQNTFASSATRQSCKSVWRFHHQSTNSLRLWISKLVSYYF
jgi:hypothetical protein